MIRLIKMLSIAGCLSLLATPASAIPFGVNVTGGGGIWAVSNNGSVVANGHWSGGGSASFDVSPGVVSWGIGGIFCPCSWSMTLGGTTVARGSSLDFAFKNIGRTVVAAAEETALKVREPTIPALLGLALFGIWFATRRRKRLVHV